MSEMLCKRCQNTGDHRYWEGRWRDEKAINADLLEALRGIEERANSGEWANYAQRAHDAIAKATETPTNGERP